jgi:hypothetical protein
MAVPLEALGIRSENENEMMGMGWLHDLPDLRDYTLLTPVIAKITDLMGLLN